MKKNDIELLNWLAQRKKDSLYRQTHKIETGQHVKLSIKGKKILSFCSNDYLGLASHPKIIAAFKKGVDQYGVGSGGSHLVTGHSIEHDKLEKELAEFTNREDALLFSNGYMANLGIVTSLMEPGDIVFQDRLNHASLIDASRLSGSKMKRYLHNDMVALARKIDSNRAANTMIATDGVFSMDGDIANIDEIINLSQINNAWVLVDDAHGFGVLGQRGSGVLEASNTSQDDVPLYMATLGKAVGVSGAFVAGSKLHMDYIRQRARTWMYTTASPPALAVSTRVAISLIQEESWRRERLISLIAEFRTGAIQLGLKLLDSSTAIQAVIIGSNNKALEISENIFKKGILVTAIRPPTVPNNTARLRITLSALHESADIRQLLGALEQQLKCH